MATIERAKTAGGGTLTDSEDASAKINLALHVTGRRDDSYHTIETLAVFAEFGDTVGLAVGDGPRLDVSGPFGGALTQTPASDNLVLRAAEALAAAAGRKAARSHLRLAKCIPVAAGLGGGSADAAATLRLLDRAWKTNLGMTRLAEIGAKLGADVPMCLVSRPLVASGVGEKIALFTGMPPLALVLVQPGVAVSTAAVFAARSGPFGSPLPALPARFADAADLAGWLKSTRNDLEGSAATIAPTAAAGAAALRAEDDCLFARMSGSGAAAFGLFPSPALAERAAARIRTRQPNWRVVATMTRPSIGDRL